MRRLLYQLASLLGWFNAAARDKLPQRLIRVVAYKELSKALRKFVK